jgi:hypothetical protein
MSAASYLVELLRAHVVASVDALSAAVVTLHNDPSPEACELFEDTLRYVGKITRALAEALRLEGSE